jgi:putative Mn2+ efflux pump MntP
VTPFEVILLSVALSMDAFFVSLSWGVAMKRAHLPTALRLAFFLGAFHVIMPIIGWELGKLATGYVSTFGSWIAAALLSFLGGKIVYEASKEDTGKSVDREEDDDGSLDFIYAGEKDVQQEEMERRDLSLNILVLLALAFATSIDAAAVGLSFSMLEMAIIFPAFVIGCTAFALSMNGTFIGNKVGDIFGKKVEIISGLVLIIIGIKILLPI